MENLKLSFALLVLFGFVCACSGNAISSLFGKSGDDKAEADGIAAVNAATSAAKSAAEVSTTTTTTTTPQPGTSCGGLKGFLHICDKNEPTDAPKTLKTRSVSKDDDSDSDSDSDDSDDSSDSDEKSEIKPTFNTTDKAIAKRQAEDPQTSEAPEEQPPMVDSALPQPQQEPEEAAEQKNRQTDYSSSSEESEDNSRRRRDCRDRYGDYDKNC